MTPTLLNVIIKTRINPFGIIKNVRYQSILSSQLIYKDFGDPIKVIEKCNVKVEKPQTQEILIKMLAAPVNPADINTIQGKYPVQGLTLPAVPGNEGVGEVIAIGDQVNDFQIGDRVIPLLSNLGTWQTHTILNSKLAYKIPKALDVIAAAQLTVNPCTAYRMLEDFTNVSEGETVIQNGANSAVGQNVIQLCKARKINTINIVRDRKDIKELKAFLKGLGGTEVLTEQEVAKFRCDTNIRKPKLGFNCVGGKNALEMLRHLDHNGIMVTYGGMSREPVTIPTSALIFKNIQFYGFWMTRWTKENFNTDLRWKMFNDIVEMMIKGDITTPVHKLVPFNEYQEALMNTVSVQGFAGKKYILDFNSV